MGRINLARSVQYQRYRWIENRNHFQTGNPQGWRESLAEGGYLLVVVVVVVVADVVVEQGVHQRVLRRFVARPVGMYLTVLCHDNVHVPPRSRYQVRQMLRRLVPCVDREALFFYSSGAASLM